MTLLLTYNVTSLQPNGEFDLHAYNIIQIDWTQTYNSYLLVSSSLMPKAWLPGGYGPFYAKLSDLVMSAAPPAVNNSDDFYECN